MYGGNSRGHRRCRIRVVADKNTDILSLETVV
jgi:hypothetical protein